MSDNSTAANDSYTTPPLIAVRFPLGYLLVTPGSADAIADSKQSPQEFISKHARLEQGELSEEDYRENLFSVSRQLRIFSAFRTDSGVKVWVITEADRSATTILLPSEY
jgi:hypothetical protein